MSSAEAQVNAGTKFYNSVLVIDGTKIGKQLSDIEAELSKLYSQFCKEAGLGLQIDICFCDVHLLMGKRWHTELAFVELAGQRCKLSFHTKLLETIDPNAALIFVAKSWILTLVIDRAIKLGLNHTGEFVFEIGDNGGLDSVSFCSSNPGACLILDYDFAKSNGYRQVREQYANALPKWEQRADRIFWRGATTGRRLTPPPPEGEPDDLMWLQRFQLCLAVRNPAIEPFCDVGISQIIQIPEPYLQDRIVKAGFMKPKVAREEFNKFKYVLDIDGNSNAWSGLFCSLLGGSCVLKVASIAGYREWYYDSLRPWREYVPIAADFSDMPAVIAWVHGHEELTREIARRGRELAERTTMQAAIRRSAENLMTWLGRRGSLAAKAPSPKAP